MKKNISKEEVNKLYDQLGISPKFYNLNQYPFFDSNKDEHLAWKPLTI